ncbi:DNA/RNA polymerase [Coemansia reversa NRRL 1564]|uniref:DNA/RNA polymerase n=1 Tax=Coemansia reversa (strain ATCC 12441 / NRRL 1564) TaxID=763665 RepID=A0A2G5B4Z4_COERN|nr:DNA/RNA polymerase [Coemansia reversa NRRL 1564]|eukprot:PIA14075.1 DNA/RNA polymerase [Coemansia reversa NRRL 1564]
MIGKGTVREYPGGCPPPAAYAPIRPPMHAAAKPIYVVQHMLSEAARKARDDVVSVHLQYGIDEPSQAFAQLPIFTKSKPNTTERHVLFDDSANNSLNMISVGMQLPTPMECALFLCDAHIVSSVDMASFFTQLRLAGDVANYWTYDSGEHGKLRNRRMVQGNSESPAIAQAFILHVLNGILELRDRLLAYIDNIYLKSTTEDMDAHIADVGHFIRCLAKANVTINMRKSLWCAMHDVEVLRHTWSADHSWSTFDHRVETLCDLPLPSNLGAIRRLCGGVNAITEHIEWSQALLVPFYEATSKPRLTKVDIDALCEPWAALKQALLDVKSLYVPPPGVPLVLRTDAAGAGVGAVLLAQRSEDPNDLAPVCYFSCAFGGKQGRKHSTWHKACAVYEAVKFFYPYLDGCINLWIETDCGTVVSLFSHKALNDADPLAQFKLGLTELGIKKQMIVHCRGVDQQTADWLLWAKERLHPDKLPTSDVPDMADTTIGGGNNVEYVIGVLTGEDPNGDNNDEAADSDATVPTPAGDATPATDNEPAPATSNDAASPGDDGSPAPPTQTQQYGALVWVLNVPSPTNFTNCQHDNDEIQHWIRKCQACEDIIGELTPDFNEVEKKCLRGNVPVLTRQAAREYIKLTHKALAYAGYTCTLDFVS